MKAVILMIFSAVSISAQGQINIGGVIRSEDKLRFLDSLNKYRIEAGVPALEYSFQEDSLARLRVNTLFNHVESLSEEDYKSDWQNHLHFDLRKDIKAYDKSNVVIDSFINMYGECAARLSRFSDTDDMANKLFQGWKNSKPHWELMLSPNYKTISLFWFIDDQRELRLRKGTFASLILLKKAKEEEN
jgi:uncharacterized protein YkwD